MPPPVDCAKSLANSIEIESRRSLLSADHMRELHQLANDIRGESGHPDVPDFDPLDGGINAECLFVLEAPGPKAKGGFVSRNNPDQTAKNWFEFNVAAGIDRQRTLIWNVVPWYIGFNAKIRPARRADIRDGLPLLERLVTLLPNLRIVVLVGRKAAADIVQSRLRTCFPRLRLFETPHPSQLNLNRWPQNKDRIIERLTEVRFALDEFR